MFLVGASEPLLTRPTHFTPTEFVSATHGYYRHFTPTEFDIGRVRH